VPPPAYFNSREILALLEAKARHRDLKLAEVLSLVDALESEGKPEDARAARADPGRRFGLRGK
jgi:hypothetical protein